jgi:hypothetical protein
MGTGTGMDMGWQSIGLSVMCIGVGNANKKYPNHPVIICQQELAAA